MREPGARGNVVFLSDPDSYDANESRYIQVRTLEGRVLADHEVSELPFVSSHNPHHKEWSLRAKSFKRLLSIIKKKNPATLLDIGCGNGWFLGNLLHELRDCQLSGVDLNQVELNQASQLFEGDRVNFYYLDLTKKTFFEPESFDVIVFNASIQYFEDLSIIVGIAKTLLKKQGILLINDSPFYENDKAAQQAGLRTQAYYEKLGVPEMSKNYFHHTMDTLDQLGFKKYSSWRNGIKKYPFPLFIYNKSQV